MPLDLSFNAEIWLWQDQATWVFVTLPKRIAAEIDELFKGRKKPYGTVKVTAIVGGTRWNTSIFRDKKRATCVLPLKAAVRAKERLQPGDNIEVALLIDDPF